jgi:hypothetical protein
MVDIKVEIRKKIICNLSNFKYCENAVVDYYKKRGCKIFKIPDRESSCDFLSEDLKRIFYAYGMRLRGVPDFLVQYSKFFEFVEVKSMSDGIKYDQIWFSEKLKSLGLKMWFLFVDSEKKV